ncbi:uncharacterized protein CTHT_0017540 [Thermochaetoides thermophila DSM 1495]|uniref:DASH complex subunit DAM1 n=1 Tax=Chaetomium thermophilum (strain DSM 1495 / CBS 144.50 / IMI 039719) TaxID=759272 RepID=DAM1_CHATD|nr:hypothetical protein CTHT_0017540 [Thermochaetoides thermophila DSM 1495]G0S2K4.1 RecName: Full=DASH complex subunit DAM1; AltName: Full=Outer kinetochore protein DAM1 [Thermochaetoides thermophila DSM 1495]EGS22237.1 hypothetical protein CTHT_0017540 [Thermochaetoides thermophila DSM 1495]
MAPEDTNPQSSHRRTRSTSRSRPTTPLRPSSRSSFRSSARGSVYGDNAAFPLNAFEPAFAELADAVADLEANMMHFQLMHESLARFSESFASFLYGLNMNAFCVDFPEGPITESFKRMKLKEEEMQASSQIPSAWRGDPPISTPTAIYPRTDIRILIVKSGGYTWWKRRASWGSG